MNKFVVASLTAVAALAVAGWSTPSLNEAIEPPKGLVNGLEAHETHAGATLLGQFRTSVNGWLWVRTDLYLHNGVEMRPRTRQEAAAGEQIEAAADGQEMDHAELTVVPSAKRDFRGIWGDVERVTTAYKGMKGHDHNDPIAVLPLFKLMVLVDPNFVPAWTMGSSVLAGDRSQRGLSLAIRNLKEGLKHNPHNIALLNELGMLQATRIRDFAAAISTFEDALSTAKRSDFKLDEEDLEAVHSTYRWLALSLRETQEFKKMRDTASEGLIQFKDDEVLVRLRDYAPPIFTPKGAAIWRASL